MKNEKLTAVTNKICELLKGCDLDPIHYDTDNLNHGPIREAEVLGALNKIGFDNCSISSDGSFNFDRFEYWKQEDFIWTLGQSLSNQPQEVIEFLFNVLNCEKWK